MILEGIGATLIGGATLYGIGSYMFSEKNRIKRKFRKACNDGELYKEVKYKDKKHKVFPHVLGISINDIKTVIVFSIPSGLNPKVFEDRKFVFRQHFGKYLDLQVEDNRAFLHIYPKGLPKQINYDYNLIRESLEGKRLPILCGQGLDLQIHTLDMVSHPHVLIAGETGSGKSSAIRSILTTIIQTKSPKEVRFILGDLKRSEFHLFKNLKHVEGVYHSAEELEYPLKQVKKEMVKRGNLLNQAGVNSIDELKNKPPYLVICIDEVVLLKKEKGIMDILEEISSIGRSLGVFLILSMQRPDSKLLDGKLKVNMTVRMGFKTADRINARIIGTEGAESLETAGRMLLRVNSELKEVQCTWLCTKVAQSLLVPYKEELKITPPPADNDQIDNNIMELFKK
ncbi:hypothetical protein LRS37_12930 [Neobacillus sedimentimangrovi]|uniref:FtsK domain-containing protein n=1 Tax=Neobacillus sedimentimangrovi TaxID=2699460 RepID=A0ABS8QKD9_9BACI|nr:FtsK/SpoIIIE domain-containing protein [Neobacillus sedimentimangrovi]MCD4839754.1 hypothetical protein [Neobacillus sedimentimangrovi]